MATNTTNYNLIKPAVNDPTDQNLWGGYLNTNFDTIDGLLKTASDTAIGSAKTANYTILSTDQNGLIRGDASGGAFDFDLPAASSVGAGFMVSLSKIDSSANAITIDPDGSDTVDVGTLSNQFDSVMIVSDGTSHWAAFSLGGATVYPQVVQVTNSTLQSGISTTYTDISSFSPSITPNIRATGVLVSFHVAGFQDGSDGSYSNVRIMRDIDGGGYSDISGDLYFVNDRTNSSMPLVVGYEFLDTGATPGSVVTYKLQVKSSNASSSVSVHYGNTKSTFILKEVIG